MTVGGVRHDGFAHAQMNLSIKTLAVTASHFDGALEYDMHNLYGMYECKSTATALRAIRQKRHFILTRCPADPEP